jgi:hypothetical protein
LIGESLHSKNFDTPEVTYLDTPVDRNQLPITQEQGVRLLNGLLSLIGETSTLIAHDTDLIKLEIGYAERDNFLLKALRKGRGQSDWYVRTIN